MKGFTLIEVLITMLIISIVIAGLFMVLNIADFNWSLGEGLLGLQQQVRQAMDGVVREIRQSRNSNIYISSDYAYIQFDIPTDITTEPVTYSELISYYADSGQLIRRHPQDSLESKVVANDINRVSFCCWHGTVCDNICNTSNLVEIQLVAGKTIRQRPVSFSLTEKVRLRN